MTSFKLAAIKILKESKEPLHYEEITKRALDKNLIETTGQTPEATMNAQIAVDIKIKKENSAFIRSKPGYFTLNPNYSKILEKEELITALKEYCKQDTWVEIVILRKLFDILKLIILI